MNKYPLGPGSAQARHHFEDDAQFHERADLVQMIIGAYHRASSSAAITARQAVAIGTDAHRARALWDEAVAKTLERVLDCLGNESGAGGVLPPEQDIILPERPEFIR